MKPPRPWIVAVATIVAGIAIYLLWDLIVDYILYLFGIGAGATALLARQSQTSQAQADEHVDMMNHDINQSVVDQRQADAAREEVNDFAESITDIPTTPAPGKIRKKFEIR